MIKPFRHATLNNVTQYYKDTHKAIDWLPHRDFGLLAYGTPLVAPEDEFNWQIVTGGSGTSVTIDNISLLYRSEANRQFFQLLGVGV